MTSPSRYVRTTVLYYYNTAGNCTSFEYLVGNRHIHIIVYDDNTNRKRIQSVTRIRYTHLFNILSFFFYACRKNNNKSLNSRVSIAVFGLSSSFNDTIKNMHTTLARIYSYRSSCEHIFSRVNVKTFSERTYGYYFTWYFTTLYWEITQCFKYYITWVGLDANKSNTLSKFFFHTHVIYCFYIFFLARIKYILFSRGKRRTRRPNYYESQEVDIWISI